MQETPDEYILLSLVGEAADVEAFSESAMPKHRPLTDKEKSELKLPWADLHCSVAFFEGKGFCAYTHRARTKYYRRAGDIPRAKLEFIGTTS